MTPNCWTAAPKLKVIARAGARLDNVDIDDATRRGVLVIHVPGCQRYRDGGIYLLADAVTGTQLGKDNQQVENRFGFQLSGKNLGIIGFGHQGREVATRAQAFGMHVLAYDPYIDLSFARERGVEIVDLPELLARADLITLHTAYRQQTRKMINAQSLALMKPGRYLINCIHAGLVDETAVLEALDNGTLAGAALDTWDQQASLNSDTFHQHPRVLGTPIANKNTLESQVNTATSIVSDLLAVLRGEDFHHIVNLPFNDQTPYQSVKPYIDLAVKLGKLQGQLAGGWIQRVEVELLGEGLRELVRPVAAVLLSGMIRPMDARPVNWVSAPVMAHEQGILLHKSRNWLSKEITLH